MRKADETTVDGNGDVVAVAYKLGHWEAAQLSIALDNLADATSDVLDSKLAVRDLARVFGALTGAETFTITVTYAQ